MRYESLRLIASNHAVERLIYPIVEFVPGSARPVRAVLLPVADHTRVIIQLVVTCHADGEYRVVGGANAFHYDL